MLNVTTVLLTGLQSCLIDFSGLNFRCAQLWSSVWCRVFDVECVMSSVWCWVLMSNVWCLVCDFVCVMSSVSCNYIAVDKNQIFLYWNSIVQTLKAKVTYCPHRFLYRYHLPAKISKCSLKFQKPVSTDLMTSLEIHGCYFRFSANLSV